MAPENPVDAEELLEALTVTPLGKPHSCGDFCSIGACRPKCALEVVDELLSLPEAVSGEEVDLLLDFRFLLRGRQDALATLHLFCELRRRLEQRHYLAFYRLRSWLANHLLASIRACPAAEPKVVPVRFTFYCLEAIRRDCLCAALGRGTVLLAPRVTFGFRLLPDLAPPAKAELPIAPAL